MARFVLTSISMCRTLGPSHEGVFVKDRSRHKLTTIEDFRYPLANKLRGLELYYGTLSFFEII